ncbi:MAG: ribonuclease H family protein [Bacteroidales bacterium]|jgi:ribonuclease HI|nr:ribonuclease H family protein [Bacteroidales bacterium]MDD2204926.1 ribonuclease H family protein [Bacteroidales bacterium]MDD3152691.1 ribonuclease H family protein [Bacteroidales bacterium]MDD3914549.1 ribonuclease H family protein [Bacteroidales bacterium]MDD4634443.1 ribonuclease H family protein [Bacteroidales bacterium]
MVKKQKYYVVWHGNRTGVFDSWAECKDAIEGFNNAKYKSFETESEAVIAFRNAFSDYIGKKTKTDFRTLIIDEKPVMPSIAVDAACSGNPGVLEFRGVEVETSALFFYQGHFSDGTNNIGEFLAIAWALALLKKSNCSWPIYSDSETAITWIKNKKVNTKCPHTKENERLFFLVDKALNWLKTNTYTTQILKWNTELWGEIPADFDRKR